MKEKYKVFVILLTLGVICYYSLDFFNKNIYAIWNANKIKVSTLDIKDKEKINIYYGVSVNSINRKNDASLFTDMDKYTILIERGEQKSILPNEYGENDFLITFDNKYYFSFRQFKLNNNHQHLYDFRIQVENNTPHIYVNIEGKDGMDFDKMMISISDTINYICNSPIDSAGVLYNMIEL